MLSSQIVIIFSFFVFILLQMFLFYYQRNPYQRFEGSEPWADGGNRDPRKLIERSIREIAAELAIGRFYTQRI